MSAFQYFVICCPACHSRLSGVKINPEEVQYSELYSDGLMLCDGLMAEEQKLISCPACAHLFWAPTVEKHACDADTCETDQTIYPHGSWYQFGCNTSNCDGKIALIEHYRQLLQCIRPLNSELEIYLRKKLLWAINNLIRQRSEASISQLLSGKSSFAHWRASRRNQTRQNLAFMGYRQLHISNIQRLIELLRSNEEREQNRLFLCELYREKGNFSKCLEMVRQLKRSTHFLTLIEEKARLHNSFVFKVAG
ncbi:MAG: hypothetical protein IPM52_11645 [Bacteroidetes bacterium]|nr:hypothetical protein [Bacteroidota bacterium]